MDVVADDRKKAVADILGSRFSLDFYRSVASLLGQGFEKSSHRLRTRVDMPGKLIGPNIRRAT